MSSNATLELDISETREQAARQKAQNDAGQDETLKTTNMKNRAEL